MIFPFSNKKKILIFFWPLPPFRAKVPKITLFFWRHPLCNELLSNHVSNSYTVSTTTQHSIGNFFNCIQSFGNFIKSSGCMNFTKEIFFRTCYSIPNFIILNVPNCLYLNNSDCIISFGSYFNSFMIFFNSIEIFNIIRSFVNSFRNFISTNIPLSINLRLYDVNYLLLCKDKNLNISLLLDEICMSRTYLFLNIFFLGKRKNCEKVSPYFSLSGVEKFPNLHFFGKIFFQIGTFLAKICNFWGKIANFRG